ncbi:multidrug and toxin extrusion protein 1-like [Stylophora pistillata]|uniref:multidrug and toxin extrusion protein 1-like n=1 Tax=Stylophora pistillata TaxID=50429 RepID=UPI000C03C72E|nr:multidrug and toxin extrusion protein 1-like [Stylophora pistillata]
MADVVFMKRSTALDKNSKALFTSRVFDRVLSQETRGELRQLVNLSWRPTLTNVLHSSLFTTSLLFAGRLGEQELAATVLSTSFIGVTGTFLGSGLITALEVLCTQAFRNRSYRLVGITFQRGVWLLGISVLFVWAIWTNAKPLLLIIKQKREVVRLSQLFVFVWFPAVAADFAFALIQRYLQIQGVFKPMIYIVSMANILHLGINFILIHGLKIGFLGVALASSLTHCLFLGVSSFLYLFCSKLYQRTWPSEGWTRESLQQWGQFIMLAAPGILMLCNEWWSFVVGIFLMGTLGQKQLAVHGILMQFTSFVYMIAVGFSLAVTDRVRNELRRGDHTRAKHVAKVSLVAVSCFSFVMLVFFNGLNEHLGKAFTDDRLIASFVRKVTPAMTGFSFFQSLQVICCGIIRGIGRVKLAVFLNFFFHFFVSVPLGSCFAFYVFKEEVEGFWWGLTTGLSLQCLLFIGLIWRIDWELYVRKVRRSLTRQLPKAPLGRNTGTEQEDEENLIVTWLSRTSSLFSVNTNSLREFSNPSNPVMSWIYRSSSLLSLNTIPLRAMNTDQELVLLEDGPFRHDCSVVSKTRISVHGNKLTSKEKCRLILSRLVWLVLAVFVLLTAIVVRVRIPAPEEQEQEMLRDSSLTELLINSTRS